ncbi:adenylyl-sulfate kinase [Fictibacillus phosphorivorans]|uniref:adenylyl-sulfate kinase n=1 Tax=Fictibacillus phosphorivorans TaxID=1221500 RepID=UPI00203F548A|nr:adenylyl-sulfate kinase [Fictibacillus phosphorivorans]MCM3719150.1 adenylyl-sulfate kinase [Fictibacillus phosphorivorans]MCM3776772.1 adenylyl-sulfate kinase [Fictibacillus phosphorivorans]
MNQHIFWQQTHVTKKDRQQKNGYKSAVFWLTGLSGSGKSTLANQLEKHLFHLNYSTYLLDGDNVRHGLNADLGFSQSDRIENIRRIGEVSKLFVDAGLVVVTAFVSPYTADRKFVRDLFNADEFFEIYIECPIEECEKRDPKGLYKKARDGTIKEFTGVQSPYEVPPSPDLVINTAKNDIETCTSLLLDFVKEKLKK